MVPVAPTEELLGSTGKHLTGEGAALWAVLARADPDAEGVGFSKDGTSVSIYRSRSLGGPVGLYYSLRDIRLSVVS